MNEIDPTTARGLVAAFLASTVLLLTATVALVGEAWAGPGELLPGPERLRARLAGPLTPLPSSVERLLAAAEGPFNGHGTMRPAFTTKSRDWERVVEGMDPTALRTLTDEREGEGLALLAWVRDGADRTAYDADAWAVPADLAGQPLASEWRTGKGGIRIRSLIETRCVDCHKEGGRMERAGSAPLDSYERLRPYVASKPAERLPLPALLRAATPYGFGVMVCLTGTGFLTLTSRAPRRVKVVLAPWPLAAAAVLGLSGVAAAWSEGFVWGVVAGAIATAVGVLAQLVLCSREWIRLGRHDRESGIVPAP